MKGFPEIYAHNPIITIIISAVIIVFVISMFTMTL